ncbi:MAG: cyclic nucleotide-binding domain-containing protein [Nitrospinota bacterium]|nr:MAG: cyclic nucleotide-binding domain-containing protein [Nitrospinota bacterium]
MREELLARLPRLKVEAGTILFEEGDAADKMYLIVRGKVRITKQVIEGADKLLAELGEGEYFGEMGLLADLQRSATATAVEESEFVLIDRDSFGWLLQENPSFGLSIMKQLAQRLERSNEELVYVSLQMALAERKPHRFPAGTEGKSLFVITGSFAPVDTARVIKAHARVTLPHRTDLIVSLMKPGRGKEALIYVLETETPKELLELLRPFGDLVEWEITPAIPLDDPVWERLGSEERE